MLKFQIGVQMDIYDPAAPSDRHLAGQTGFRL